MKYEINWSNLDLNDEYQRNLPVLDSYDIETLLLEINCNIKDKTKENIRKHFLEILQNKHTEAIEILESNLDNIIKYIKNEEQN